MTDEDQNEPVVGAAGAELRGARESAKRELAELATQLHLDIGLLEAIEADEFEKLGAPVFARGHLRKYAEALGVDSHAAVAQYEALQDPNELPPVVAPINNRRLGTKVPGWALGLALGLAVLVILLLWFVGRTDGSADSAPLASPGSASAPVAVVADDDLVQAIEADSETLPAVVPAPVATAAAAATVDAAPTPAPPRTRDELEIDVSAECWIEVRDSGARRLFAGTAAAGRVLKFNGRAPFSLVIGNRRAVSIRQNDKTIAIPADAIRGRTARFNTPSTQTG